MFTKNTIVIADGVRYFIVNDRGSIDFAIGLDNDTYTSRFDKDYFKTIETRQPTTEECFIALDKILQNGVMSGMID